MTETTTATTSAAKKAAQTAASSVSEALPTVVETAEISMEVPAKVVLNQKLVVIGSVLAGAALATGAIWGVNKWRNRNKDVVEVDKPDDEYTSRSDV